METNRYEKAITYNDIVNFKGKYKKLYVYGAGKYGRLILEKLLEKKIEVAGVVVSCKEDNPDNLLGVVVTSLSEIDINNHENGFILGVSNNYIHEVIKTLLSGGHNNILEIEDIKAITGGMGWKTLAKLPKLEITAKIGCSIQCKYCPQQAFYKAYFSENKNRCALMSLEDYKTCIDKTPENTVISFAGFVEPFHHPQAVEMIRYAHESGRYVELFTTLVGMTEDMFEQIKDIPFVEVVLHTPDRDNYANIPMTEEYFKVLDKVLDHKKPDGSPFVDSANCQSEPAEEFLKAARDRIIVKSVLVDRAGNLESEGLKKSHNKKGKIYCRRSLKQNHWVLLPDGSMVLCCMDFGMRHVVGNLLEKEYDEILRGEEYITIRRKMMELMESSDLLCRDCTSAGEISELKNGNY